MSRQGSRSAYGLICISLILFVLLLTGCRGGGSPTPAPTVAGPTTAAATQPAPLTAPPTGLTPALSTAEPTSAPGFAAGTVILNQSASLAVQGGDVEMSFDSVAFQVIRIDSELSSGLVEYKLHLMDKFGNIMATLQGTSNDAAVAINEFTLPYDGTYRIVLVPSAGEGSLQVTVTALSVPTGGGLLAAAGETLPGEMAVRGVYHTYQFTLAAGEVVTIAAEAASNGAPDTFFTLYGPDGRFVTQVDDVKTPENLNAVLPGFVASLAGPYTAIVGNYGETQGTYTFRVSPDTEPPAASGQPNLVYNTDYRAALYEGSPLSATFDGSTGDVLRIEAFDLAPEVDVDLRLYSPFDQVIAYAITAEQGQNEAIGEVQLPYTGRYRLELTALGSGQASFHLIQASSGDLTGGGILGDEPSATRSGRINAANVFHYYQFNAAAGDQITITVRSSNIVGELDMGFALLGPDGHQMIFADDAEDSDSPDPELIDYEVSQTGSYVIVVYAFNDALGTYELSYQRWQR